MKTKVAARKALAKADSAKRPRLGEESSGRPSDSQRVKRTINIETVHAMVQTMQVWWNKATISEPFSANTLTKEEVTLPPVRLINTQHDTVGVSLISSLEKHVFGTSLPEFMKLIAKTFLVCLIVWVCDSASSNLLLYKYWRALFHTLDCAIHILLWTERCGLHQVCDEQLICPTPLFQYYILVFMP